MTQILAIQVCGLDSESRNPKSDEDRNFEICLNWVENEVEFFLSLETWKIKMINTDILKS